MTFNTIEPFPVEVWDRTWGKEILVASTPHYTGKVLFYEAGKAGGLQLHRRKIETFYLHSGRARVEYDDGQGTLVSREMVPGESFHIPAGSPHRFLALEDCVVFEASTPVFDDRMRLEEHYQVDVIGDAYGLETTEPK